LINLLAQHLGSKQIAEVLSQSGVLSKNQAYQLALELKNADAKEDSQTLED
jgi:16S rRNA (cytidine1402-2'-O)-methyltransferase